MENLNLGYQPEWCPDCGAPEKACQCDQADTKKANERDFAFCRDCERPWVCADANECKAPCLICCGEGTVDGRDYFDPLLDDEYFDPMAICPSCHGSGLAKDMQWC